MYRSAKLFFFGNFLFLLKRSFPPPPSCTLTLNGAVLYVNSMYQLLASQIYQLAVFFG